MVKTDSSSKHDFLKVSLTRFNSFRERILSILFESFGTGDCCTKRKCEIRMAPLDLNPES